MSEITGDGQDGARRSAETSVTGAAPAEAGRSTLSGAERPGDFIGPYKLLEIIGEGGFGVVWLAERREPMVQRVALKVIKPGMDSKAVLARFEQERQALAVMDHPNLAKVFDGGVTDRGRPYFVMEHVKGEPITTFADRHRLTLKQRLQLFIPVCDAVQHAHMKGIIHRDLKPSNILVSPVGAEPAVGLGPPGMSVKVIDFGVAKAISHTLTGMSIYTEQGQLIGTPEYMSPEQAEMGATDIDTRSDVYSLGVVLYELLSGTLPFDTTALRRAGYAEIQRIIREVDPPRPSTRLSTIDDETGLAIARARQAVREKISGELKRELEWIPLKALRKDRTRRYASAESLAADVRRYLEGRPLVAAPESRSYLLRKFARRHRASLSVAATIALLLAAGVLATSFGFMQAERQRERAQREAQTANAALEVIDRDIFGAADPELEGPQLRAADLLYAARVRLESRDDQPAFVRARVSHSLGAAFLSVGLPQDGRALLEQARGLYGGELSDAVREDLESRLAEAQYRSLSGAEASETLRRLIASSRFDREGTLRLQNQLGGALKWAGQLDQAEAVYQETLAGRLSLLGPAHVDVFITRHNLALVKLARSSAARSSGRADEAEKLLSEALQEEEALLKEFQPRRASSRLIDTQWLASAAEALAMRVRLHRDAQAMAEWKSLLQELRRRLGLSHWRVLDTTVWCARLLARNNQALEAMELYVIAHAVATEIKGPEDPYTRTVAQELALQLDRLGCSPQASEPGRDRVD